MYMSEYLYRSVEICMEKPLEDRQKKRAGSGTGVSGSHKLSPYPPAWAIGTEPRSSGRTVHAPCSQPLSRTHRHQALSFRFCSV